MSLTLVQRNAKPIASPFIKLVKRQNCVRFSHMPCDQSMNDIVGRARTYLRVHLLIIIKAMAYAVTCNLRSFMYLYTRHNRRVNAKRHSPISDFIEMSMWKNEVNIGEKCSAAQRPKRTDKFDRTVVVFDFLLAYTIRSVFVSVNWIFIDLRKTTREKYKFLVINLMT